ncbi:MAG: hypothetical protein JWO82_2503 [Akkermansiaceae bacterium]|nr:hypothetical protein [Akkermansiaceae bacterium]
MGGHVSGQRVDGLGAVLVDLGFPGAGHEIVRRPSLAVLAAGVQRAQQGVEIRPAEVEDVRLVIALLCNGRFQGGQIVEIELVEVRPAQAGGDVEVRPRGAQPFPSAPGASEYIAFSASISSWKSISSIASMLGGSGQCRLPSK